MLCCGRLQFPALVEGPSSSSLRISKLKIYINKNRELCITYVCIYITQYNTTRTRFPPLSCRRALWTVILDVPTYTVNKRNEPVTILCAPGEEFAWRPVMVTSCCRRRGAPDRIRSEHVGILHTLKFTLSDCTPQKIKLISKAKDNNLFTAHPFTCTKILYIYHYVYIWYAYYNICVYTYIVAILQNMQIYMDERTNKGCTAINVAVVVALCCGYY